MSLSVYMFYRKCVIKLDIAPIYLFYVVFKLASSLKQSDSKDQTFIFYAPEGLSLSALFAVNNQSIQHSNVPKSEEIFRMSKTGL